MSGQPNQMWEQGGFMSAPATQQQVQTGAPGDLGRMIRDAPPKPTRGYWSLELPESIVRSMNWTGTDADRAFGMWEPNGAEVRKLVKAGTDFSDGAKNFIAALGVLDQATGKLARDESGKPIMTPADSTTAVDPWWHRLTPKAQAMVTSLFVEMIMPTEEEGESLRASRQWVGG
jgi:hypothetical protein